MYGQGNYPHHGQGSQAPRPPFAQHQVTPPFQHRPPSVMPPAGYSGPSQYQQPPPPPPQVQHGPPIHNAPHSHHLPPGPPQGYISNAVPQSYPPQQNTMWGRDTQRPPLPPLAPFPPGPNRPEMFRPSVGFAYAPQATNQLQPPRRPPPPPPASSFFTPPPMFSTGPSPPPPPSLKPPLPPSSPPSAPPPPPIISQPSVALTSVAFGAASVLPQILEPGSISETLGSDSADKLPPTSEIMADKNIVVDSDDRTDRASAVVVSPALKDLVSEEYTGLDLPPPPPKPTDENVVKKIEAMCDSIAKNGLGFECITRQKESKNPEFGFLFGGEVGSEAAAAHEYFKWVRKKCLLQRKKSKVAPTPPNMGTSTQSCSKEADMSPSFSDMEMEDDFIQPDEVHSEFVPTPEECDQERQLSIQQDEVEHSPPNDTVSTFTQSGEKEKGTRSMHSYQNDQPTHGSASLGVDSLNASPCSAVKPIESGEVGVSSSSSLEDPNPMVNSADELNKGLSPFRLLQDYASDDSSGDGKKPLLEDIAPVAVLPLNKESNASLHEDLQSNFQSGLGSVILPCPVLSSEKSSKTAEVHSLSSSPLKDQELLPKWTTAAEVNMSTDTGKVEEFVETEKEVLESGEAIVSTKSGLGGKDSLQVAHEVPPEKKMPQFRKEDIQHASTHQKVDEFGRLIRDISSDSGSDYSHRTRKHGKRGRSRSRSHDKRRSRGSPRRRRERRSLSRSWSPKKRRNRSRSPSYRRGGESGIETMKREKCLDFFRGRCYRGATCRYLHEEIDKSASARYNRNTRSSDRHEETEKSSSRRSIHKHDLPQSNTVSGKNENKDQDVKPLVAAFCKSERLSEAAATTDTKEEILESTIRHDLEHCREKEETEDLVIDKSQASTSLPILTSTTSDDQIEMSKAGLNRIASIIPNQGASVEVPAAPPSLPQSTSVPQPPIPEESSQPSSGYPYQVQSQMQQPHYPIPPNTWPLPPPPALPTPLQQQFGNNFSVPNAIQGVHPPLSQQNQFPAREDYGMFQQQSYLAPSSTEDLRSKPLSMNTPVNQTYGGMGLHPGQLSSFPLPSLGHSAAYIQQQQPHYGLHQPSHDALRFGAYANNNVPFAGSRVASHYNPYASTFDQPFDSKISSNVLNQGKDFSNANPFNVNPVVSPTKNGQTVELPKSAHKQYDPLFDSIEPPPNSFKKIDESQGLESALRISSSGNPIDVGGSYNQKEVETVAVSTSTKSNAEFGETADAEVGEVESGRSSNPHGGGPILSGEVEIDQVRSPGKGKKSKDSRSMKLFRSSLAEYVKELLKPHWRQGGMSKEAFKIIVKKTIDKVCGTMKSHHIPKSQEKVNRYIDSSQRKLNKLVMGYVDKYARI